MLLHELNYLLMEGKQSIQSPPRLLLLRKLIEEGKMVGGVRSLYYLFGEMLYQEPQLLVVQANYQTRR
jgi:hypothetical protein